MAGIPFCKDCVHFSSSRNECKRYKFHDIVNGGLKNHSAYHARYNESMCSQTGRNFEPKITVRPASIKEGYIPTILCSAEGCGVVVNKGLFNENTSNEKHYTGALCSYDYPDEASNDIY